MVRLIKKKLRLYLDTTIPNYAFAKHLPKKMKITKQLLKAERQNKYELFISDVVLRELKASNEPKRSKLLSQVTGIIELVTTPEIETLAREYVVNKIISERFIDDARHVAIAVCNNLDAVVSWNYGHLVNINKIKGVNIVNEIMGYKHIEIHYCPVKTF